MTSVMDGIVYRAGVNLATVIDFQGNLSRGISLDLNLDSLSLLTDLVVPEGSPVSIQFCFAQDFAYMRLSGHVISVVAEEGDPTERFRILIRFSYLADPERAILLSCLHEFDVAGKVPTAYGAGSNIESDPLAIMSLFITDNPYTLHYYKSLSAHGISHITPLSLKVRTEDAEAKALQAASSPRFSWRSIPKSVSSALQVGRDLLVLLLPRAAARLLARNIAFAFIAHPRDLSDVSRKFPLAHFIPFPLVERWLRYQWPIVGSYIKGLKNVKGETTTGAMLFSPLTTQQMIRNPRLARRRVFQTAKLAEKMGAQIVGLGAFASIVTKDGQDLLGKVNIGITTGNAHSAAIAVQNVVMAASLTNLSLPHATAAIVGGAGSVGSACAKILSRIVARLILVDIKKEEVKKLARQLQGQSAEVEAASRIDLVRQADIIIAVTNSPSTVISAEHLKPGAIVIDAAQPKNVSEQIPLLRRDVLVIESAVVNTPGIDCNFNLGLGPGEALGCLSETMILTAIGWQGHYSLGKADPKQAADMIAAGRKLGFRLAFFRNSLGYITEEDLVHVAKSRMTTALNV